MTLPTQVPLLGRHPEVLALGQVKTDVVQRVLEGDDLPNNGSDLLCGMLHLFGEGIESLIAFTKLGLG